MSIQYVEKEGRKLAHEQCFCFMICLQCWYDEFAEGHLRYWVEVRDRGLRNWVSGGESRTALGMRTALHICYPLFACY